MQTFPYTQDQQYKKIRRSGNERIPICICHCLPTYTPCQGRTKITKTTALLHGISTLSMLSRELMNISDHLRQMDLPPIHRIPPTLDLSTTFVSFLHYFLQPLPFAVAMIFARGGWSARKKLFNEYVNTTTGLDFNTF